MKKTLILLFLLIVSNGKTLSQIDSIQEFYPFKIGNEFWYYSNRNPTYTIYNVVKDTILSSGKLYKALLIRHGNAPDEPDYYDSVYYHIDSTTGNVYKFYGGVETLVDSMPSKQGDIFGDSIICISVKVDTIFGQITKVKEYGMKKLSRDSIYLKMAFGFGNILNEYFQRNLIFPVYDFISSRKMIYAKNGNKVFGSLLTPHQRDSLMKFHPLAFGNIWIYRHIKGNYPIFLDTTLKMRTVSKDTVIEQKQYRCIEEKVLHSLQSSVELFRIDSTYGNVYSRIYNTEYLYDTLFCSKGTRGSVYSPWMYTFKSGTDTIFGVAFPQRHVYILLNTDYGRSYEYLNGIGLSNEHEESAWGDYSDKQLIYAKINGVEYGTNPLSVQDEPGILPTTFSLSQNYPNPFNPLTTIKYQLPQSSFVTLKVFDILGKEVAEIVNEKKDAGTYSVPFNASGLASGIYFYHLRAGEFGATKKMLLLR